MEVVSDYGGETFEYRDIPTDGRARPKTVEDYYYGLPIGKWEGDTLVIDSTNFTDATWYGRGGLLHSADLHVEKLTKRDEILYQMTVEDPDDPDRAMGDAGQTLRASGPTTNHP